MQAGRTGRGSTGRECGDRSSPYRARAVETWFALCRRAPEEISSLIEAPEFPDWALRIAWRVALESDLQPQMTPAWFPAWMLLEEPGLAGVLSPCDTGDDPSRAFDALIALVAHTEPDARGIELRRALQVIHPGLLERFLAKRAQAAPQPSGPR